MGDDGMAGAEGADFVSTCFLAKAEAVQLNHIMKQSSINAEQRLFIIHCDSGFSCLGFDVCHKRATALAKELGESAPCQAIGTLESLGEYNRLVEIARARNLATGWRSESELIPELKGFEGKRVEIRHQWKPESPIEIERYIVGKSTGFIPCHLALPNKQNGGGEAVFLGTILSVRIV
jgi:hypothetical protein